MVRAAISRQANCAGVFVMMPATDPKRAEVRFTSSARSAPTRAALGKQPCVQYVRACILAKSPALPEAGKAASSRLET